MQLVIGNKNYSSWSLRPWLLLHAFGIEFSEIIVSLQPQDITERLSHYSQSAKVPVLIDGDLTVWDSLAICEYISQTYLGDRAWPNDPKQRALARSITAEMHSGFDALRSQLPMDCRLQTTITLSEEVSKDISRIKSIWSTYAKPTQDGQISLFGSFGIADCFYAPVAIRFQSYGVPVQGLAKDYMDSLLSHPAMQLWQKAAQAETETLDLT